MITSDKRIAQDGFANLTDYSAVCPEGLKRFFVYVHFTDFSTCLLSNIFAATRTAALRCKSHSTASPTAPNMSQASTSTATTEHDSRHLRPHRAIGGAFLAYLPDFE